MPSGAARLRTQSRAQGHSGPSTKQWLLARCSRRAERDVICTAAGLTVHLLHLSSFARTFPAPTLLPFWLLAVFNLMGLLLYFSRRGLYLRLRPALTVCYRLAIVAMPAELLHAAYRADQPVSAGTSAATLAWRALLTSRAFILFLPAFARRAGLVPQLALSLLAFAIAARGNADICATPLMQHSRVLRMLRACGQLASTALALLLPSAPLPPMGREPASGAAGGSTASCRQVVAFTQLALGVVAPSAFYLWEESGAAAPYAAGPPGGGVAARQALGWELRTFLWLARQRERQGLPPFLVGATLALAACWAVASMV